MSRKQAIMSDITTEQLSQRMLDAGLIESRQLDSLWAELGTREVAFEQFASLVLRKEFLTNFQLDRLIKGERTGYFYGEYKVLYLAGVGTFARVYRAVNPENGRIVCVKALRKRFRDDKAMCEQFLREGKIGMKLRHPNIVPIYEVLEVPSPSLVMEFVEGWNLREFVKVRKKLEPVEALRLAVDIMAGLAYAAQQGMTHRDLKMSNVLVTSRGRAKLVDFGLAGMSAASTKFEETNPRTIDYAGLERASGVRNNDPRSDLFFTGVILYNMLTGVSALGDTRDKLQRLSIARYQNIKPILHVDSTIPSRLAAFVMRSLELNPEKRHATAQEMHDDARRVLARLEAGDVSEVDDGRGEAIETLPTDLEGYNKSIMIVESKIEMQDLLRDRLKKYGYRVLIFSDPQRALKRFIDSDQAPADCVIFCAQYLGEDALSTFNEFGQQEATKDVPAVLLLDGKQAGLAKMAEVAPHRVTVSMPLKVRELRQTLRTLLATAPQQASTPLPQ
jgi:eukaryotic-like serine/threonine-protein kinase